MKKALFLVAALVAGSALAEGEVYRSETQALTRASSPANSDVSSTGAAVLPLTGLSGFRITLCAAASQTLTGGTLRAWVFDEKIGIWARNADLDLTIGSPSIRCKAWPNKTSSVRTGYLMYATDTVTVSGGTTVTVHYVGYRPTGGN